MWIGSGINEPDCCRWFGKIQFIGTTGISVGGDRLNTKGQRGKGAKVIKAEQEALAIMSFDLLPLCPLVLKKALPTPTNPSIATFLSPFAARPALCLTTREQLAAQPPKGLHQLPGSATNNQVDLRRERRDGLLALSDLR